MSENKKQFQTSDNLKIPVSQFAREYAEKVNFFDDENPFIEIDFKEKIKLKYKYSNYYRRNFFSLLSKKSYDEIHATNDFLESNDRSNFNQLVGSVVEYMTRRKLLSYQNLFALNKSFMSSKSSKSVKENIHIIDTNHKLKSESDNKHLTIPYYWNVQKKFKRDSLNNNFLLFFKWQKIISLIIHYNDEFKQTKKLSKHEMVYIKKIVKQTLYMLKNNKWLQQLLIKENKESNLMIKNRFSWLRLWIRKNAWTIPHITYNDETFEALNIAKSFPDFASDKTFYELKVSSETEFKYEWGIQLMSYLILGLEDQKLNEYFEKLEWLIVINPKLNRYYVTRIQDLKSQYFNELAKELGINDFKNNWNKINN
ncbi:hypothetical protein [Mycoplasmopsis agassizii]|uniref:Uncharacterized protein n=1 Tax=Mycoplasmopsis agassizii TaxID=33922 RepID=A0ABX4H4F3_9BACT|nr:hypothetical protein [Mycoplasmopsis agassizii]PAF54772.1 hypothetical protein CJF60_03480 [Mycoplasmopsis agassizii]SMC19653.1 hypothetical protein SAMN02745179_00940 [Mycoplasmopsis agassizii]